MEKEKLAPFEIENGFDAEGKPVRKHFTRSQWRSQGRMVFVGDSEAVQVIVNKANGHELCLFDISQTRDRKQRELDR